ncbi:VOC family protein [Nocardia callitridis]|uniref:VOC family protein n=1 Tax=Nocardia callitridis TaxID=648753 RepID=A0ABP9K8I2_9NOCA
MTITLSAVIVDAADLESESFFWHRILGGTIHKTPTHHFLRIAGSPVVVIQQAPEHVPPQWPDGRSQQMHVDLSVDDLAAADRLAVEAGARRLRPLGDKALSATGSGVYASPAGHPFCMRAS